jgi:hypothetical protein
MPLCLQKIDSTSFFLPYYIGLTFREMLNSRWWWICWVCLLFLILFFVLYIWNYVVSTWRLVLLYSWNILFLSFHGKSLCDNSHIFKFLMCGSANSLLSILMTSLTVVHDLWSLCFFNWNIIHTFLDFKINMINCYKLILKYCLTAPHTFFVVVVLFVCFLFWQYWGLNSGPFACLAGVLPLDPCPQPFSL